MEAQKKMVFAWINILAHDAPFVRALFVCMWGRGGTILWRHTSMGQRGQPSYRISGPSEPGSKRPSEDPDPQTWPLSWVRTQLYGRSPLVGLPCRHTDTHTLAGTLPYIHTHTHTHTHCCSQGHMGRCTLVHSGPPAESLLRRSFLPPPLGSGVCPSVLRLTSRHSTAVRLVGAARG